MRSHVVPSNTDHVEVRFVDDIKKESKEYRFSIAKRIWGLS
ncbi:MAG: hypothetical protein MPEBLZ_04385 [Candidatus Methanoperedens nitroreducens]|uniref:Uncharacterized protein n=1 Tax=Candidatus Methanoperedens nitratireducens TaxID=1392998 RepID=A0A0P8A3V4_9EURY|nr:MAG: hypothetical protein MPEBLZ_04385 [Candidatus Methanoperedens sp. BLZ1]